MLRQMLRMLRTALVTIGSCFLALLIILSVMSSKQAGRDRQRQEALRQLDRENAEEAARERKVASHVPAAEPPPADPNYDADEDINDLRSSDREKLNEAIQRIQSHKACKAVPDLLYLLETSSDNYIAGVSAQTIAVCKDRSSYDTIVDQFLRRDATPSMIDAIGKIETSDERVPEKLDKLIAEPNQDQDVPRFAIHVKGEFHLVQNVGHQ
jgi:hypothetical protein